MDRNSRLIDENTILTEENIRLMDRVEAILDPCDGCYSPNASICKICEKENLR